MISRTWVRLAILAVAVLFCSVPSGPVDSSGWKLGENIHLMESFSRALRRLEDSIERGDAARISSAADSLQATALLALETELGQPRSSRRMPDAYLQSIATTASKLRDSVGENERWENLDALRQVRASCVGCHFKFRNNGSRDDHYPAQGNTVHGRVTLKDIEGTKRDRAGGVVVFLEGDALNALAEVPRTNPKVSQRNKQFVPRILVVVEGTTVEFPNDDRVFHNVFSLSETRPFDLEIYRSGDSKSVNFPTPGLVRTFCHIHPKMSCSILVLENLFFTQADAEGHFVISGVPDGTYTLRTWNELGAESREVFEVSGNTVREISLEIVEQAKRVPHLNKFSNSYESKY